MAVQAKKAGKKIFDKQINPALQQLDDAGEFIVKSDVFDDIAQDIASIQEP